MRRVNHISRLKINGDRVAWCAQRIIGEGGVPSDADYTILDIPDPIFMNSVDIPRKESPLCSEGTACSGSHDPDSKLRSRKSACGHDEPSCNANGRRESRAASAESGSRLVGGSRLRKLFEGGSRPFLCVNNNPPHPWLLGALARKYFSKR